MRFLYGKVKARKGNIIRVKFSNPTRVLMLTEKEFNKYRNNLSFTYYGGHQEESPYEFVAPKGTTWFVVVEKGGTYHEPGDVTASFELVSAPSGGQSSLQNIKDTDPQLEEEVGEEEDS